MKTNKKYFFHKNVWHTNGVRLLTSVDKLFEIWSIPIYTAKYEPVFCVYERKRETTQVLYFLTK